MPFVLYRPFDEPLEQEFLLKERVRSLKLARTAATFASSIILINLAVGTILFGDDKGWVTCVVAAVGAGIVWYVTGTRRYLVAPTLDVIVALVLWSVLIVDYFEEGFAGNLFANYPDLSDFNTARLFNTCVMHLFIASVYMSLVFLGNFRTYLLYTIISTLAYEAFVFELLGFKPMVKILFLSLLIMAIALYFNWERERGSRDRFMANHLLDQERIKTENLLYNVLPHAVATRLQSGETVVDSYDRLAVVFVDIVGFSVMSKLVTPDYLLDLLNRFFLAADHCAERHGMEKVKTIGDAYLAVAGGVSSRGTGSREAVAFGLDLVRAVADLGPTLERGFDVRIGINTGAAIGGVIGETRLAYDYWGETVNIAARIEGCAPIGGVAISAATRAELGDAFSLEPPTTVKLKGVGDTVVYPLRRA